MSIKLGKSGYLVLDQQPIVPLLWTGDERVIYEVFARIRTDDGDRLYPSRILKHPGLMEAVDIKLLENLPRLMQAQPHCDFCFNISPHRLTSLRYMDRLLGMLKGGLLDPRRLVVDIVEDNMDTDLAEWMALQQLDDLRGLGVRLALGGFGKGGSGLSRLAATHFDMVKVSGGMEVGKRRGNLILHSIVEMVGQLGMHAGEAPTRVVVEGVESKQQLIAANEAGAHYAQGFLLAKPSEHPVEPARALRAMQHFIAPLRADGVGSGPGTRLVAV